MPHKTAYLNMKSDKMAIKPTKPAVAKKKKKK